MSKTFDQGIASIYEEFIKQIDEGADLITIRRVLQNRVNDLRKEITNDK